METLRLEKNSIEEFVLGKLYATPPPYPVLCWVRSCVKASKATAPESCSEKLPFTVNREVTGTATDAAPTYCCSRALACV